MSVRDVQSLAESLLLLGYPKTFPLKALTTKYGSLDSFKIVADILKWLADRLEPGTVLLGGTENEDDRVLLIRSATEFFVTKSTLKLNPRKLYASSIVTSKELLKITNLLTTVSSVESDNDDNEDEAFKSISQFDLGDKMNDLRRARELSSELTKRGATLYDLLSKEMVNREVRANQTSRTMEHSQIERTLKNAITSAQVKLQSAKSQLEKQQIENNALNNKLQRKKAELERSQQRLEALQKIRPAYLEEYEQYEEELKELFQQYFQVIQVRDCLRAQLNERMKQPTPIATPPIAKPSEMSMTLMAEGLVDDEDDDDDDDDYVGAGNLNDVAGAIEKINDVGTEKNLRKVMTMDNISQDFKDDGNVERSIPLKDIPNRNQTSNWIRRRNQRQSEQDPPTSSRIRPTTGRLKPKTGTAIGKHKVIGSMLGDPDDETLDSSLGSGDSGSDIDLNGIDDYGLNTDDDLSLGKLTREVHSKIPSKHHDNHSDEDF